NMCTSVEYFCPLIPVLVRCNITIVPFYIERQPVRSPTASQHQFFLQNRNHRIQHIPNKNVRVVSRTALPYFALVRTPTNDVQQSRITLRMIWNIRRDDPSCLEIGNLHSPEIGYVVHNMNADAIHGIGPEDPRIRPYEGHDIAARVNQVQVITAPIGGLRLLNYWARQRV